MFLKAMTPSAAKAFGGMPIHGRAGILLVPNWL
jgi:hypothetical protein